MDYNLLFNDYSGGAKEDIIIANENNFRQDNVIKPEIVTERNNVQFMIPDFFLNNVDYGIFIVLLYVVIILISSKIHNLYLRFISFVIISLIISSSYGVSLSVIFFVVTIENKPDKHTAMMYVVLILMSLFHIFIPMFSMSSYRYCNYIYEAITFFITIAIIWFSNKKDILGTEKEDKRKVEDNSDISKLLTSILENSNKELYFTE